MQENLNQSRKNNGTPQCQDGAYSAEPMSNGAGQQSGQQKNEINTYRNVKREEAIDVLNYMSFKL